MYTPDDMEKCVYLQLSGRQFEAAKIPHFIFWSVIDAGHILLPAVIAYVLLDHTHKTKGSHLCILVGAVACGVILTIVFPTLLSLPLNRLVVNSSLCEFQLQENLIAIY